MPKTAPASSKNKPSSNAASKQRLGVSAAWDQIFVGRNLRRIQQKAGVPRCAKGVGAAILRHDVVPAMKLFIKQACFYAQRMKRRTVKEGHGIRAYNQLYSKVGPANEAPVRAIKSGRAA